MCVCVGLLKNKIKQQLRLGRVLPLTLFRVSTGRHWGKGSNRQSQRARLGIKCCPFPPLSPPPTRSSPQTTIATGFPFHVNILYDPSLFSSSSSLGARVVEEEEEVRHKKKHKPKSGEYIHNKRKCFFFSCIVFFLLLGDCVKFSFPSSLPSPQFNGLLREGRAGGQVMGRERIAQE